MWKITKSWKNVQQRIDLLTEMGIKNEIQQDFNFCIVYQLHDWLELNPYFIFIICIIVSKNITVLFITNYNAHNS